MINLDMNEIEYITVDLERILKTLKFILNIFENRVCEEYFIPLKCYDIELYDELI